jgi:hypothetical protein
MENIGRYVALEDILQASKLLDKLPLKRDFSLLVFSSEEANFSPDQ